MRSAEHGGEDRTVVLDPLEYLAAFADPHDRACWCILASGSGEGSCCLDPDGTIGVEADTIGEEAISPHPPIGQAAIDVDVERDEPTSEGLGDDERLVIRRDHHTVWEGKVYIYFSRTITTIGNLPMESIEACWLPAFM